MPYKVHLKFRENSIYIDGYEAEARTPALCVRTVLISFVETQSNCP